MLNRLNSLTSNFNMKLYTIIVIINKIVKFNFNIYYIYLIEYQILNLIHLFIEIKYQFFSFNSNNTKLNNSI